MSIGEEVEGEGEEPKEEEEKIHLMELDEYYPEGHLEKTLEDSSISKSHSKFL
jgi:hypothetical protein